MTYSVEQICERYGVGHNTVYKWIHRGELLAVNVSRDKGTKPKYRITDKALQAFESARMTAPKVATTRRRRPAQDDTPQFYK